MVVRDSAARWRLIEKDVVIKYARWKCGGHEIRICTL